MQMRKPAKGHVTAKKPNGMKKIAVFFDEDTFAEILKTSQALDISFAEQVRILVTWGLEAK